MFKKNNNKLKNFENDRQKEMGKITLENHVSPIPSQREHPTSPETKHFSAE